MDFSNIVVNVSIGQHGAFAQRGLNGFVTPSIIPAKTLKFCLTMDKKAVCREKETDQRQKQEARMNAL